MDAEIRSSRALLSARMPMVQRELVRCLTSSGGDPAEAARIAELDPVLAAQLLRHAHDQPAGAALPIRDLWDALTSLGPRAARQIVDAPSPDAPDAWRIAGADVSGLLEHAIASGVAARALMRAQEPARTGQAHLAGLLAPLSELQALLVGADRADETWSAESVLRDASDGTDDSMATLVARARAAACRAGFPPPDAITESSPDPDLSRAQEDALRTAMLDAMRLLAGMAGSTYRGPGDLRRVLASASTSTSPRVTPSLRELADLSRTLERTETDGEAAHGLAHHVLEQTRFERAFVFLRSDEQDAFLRHGAREEEAGFDVEGWSQSISNEPPPWIRVQPGTGGLGELASRVGSESLTVVPFGAWGHMPSGLLVIDRHYSGRPPRRADLDVVELLARAAGAAIEQRRLRRALDRYRDDAERDFLTGIHNRRSTMRHLDREMARARRSDTPLGLAMLDIDNFKAFNDVYGHLAGDAVLRDVARVLTETARESDIVGRYGGEEFLIVLPNATVEDTYVFAERLRGVVESYGQQSLERFPDNPPTISIGVSWILADKDTPEDAIARADRALYASKRTGRNKVCLEPADLES